MNPAKAMLPILVLVSVFAAATASATPLAEHVTGGRLDLNWVPGFDTPNSMFGRTLDSSDPAYNNPSGDHTVAVARTSIPDSGGIIVTMVNPGGMADYSWESWVFLGGGDTDSRRGLIFRGDSTDNFKSFYQFVIEAGHLQLKIRKFEAGNHVLPDPRVWLATVLPSLPQPNTWHKMKVLDQGGQIRCFFDDFELTSDAQGPLVDATTPAGWVGCYNFRFDVGHIDAYFDDLILTCPNPVAVDFHLFPGWLNLRSRGRWVTAFIQPPAPYSIADIDIASLRLNGVPAVMQPAHRFEGRGHDLVVKFSRQALAATLSPADHVPVTLTGDIGATCFQAVDYVRVMAPKVHKPCTGDHLLAGATTEVTWDVDPDAQSVTLMASLDDGATWSVAAQDVPNTGSYVWTVPDAVSGTARLQLTASYGQDATDSGDSGVYVTSDAFAIESPTGVGPAGTAELSLRSIANPSVGAIRVTFTLPTSLPATITVFDVTGREVSLREVGDLGAGVHTMSLEDQMPAGMYVVRLSQGGRSRTARITVIR